MNSIFTFKNGTSVDLHYLVTIECTFQHTYDTETYYTLILHYQLLPKPIRIEEYKSQMQINELKEAWNTYKSLKDIEQLKMIHQHK